MVGDLPCPQYRIWGQGWGHINRQGRAHTCVCTHTHQQHSCLRNHIRLFSCIHWERKIPWSYPQAAAFSGTLTSRGRALGAGGADPEEERTRLTHSTASQTAGRGPDSLLFPEGQAPSAWGLRLTGTLGAIIRLPSPVHCTPCPVRIPGPAEGLVGEG